MPRPDPPLIGQPRTVAPVVAFESEDEAIAKANDIEHGLVSYVYTRDLTRSIRVAEKLEAGMIGLNQGVVSNPAAPFGGIKHSGIGREGGTVGIDEFLETKYIALGLESRACGPSLPPGDRRSGARCLRD